MRKHLHVDYLIDDLVVVTKGKNKGRVGYIVAINVTEKKISYIVDAYIMKGCNDKERIRVSENNLCEL